MAYRFCSEFKYKPVCFNPRGSTSLLNNVSLHDPSPRYSDKRQITIRRLDIGRMNESLLGKPLKDFVGCGTYTIDHSVGTATGNSSREAANLRRQLSKSKSVSFAFFWSNTPWIVDCNVWIKRMNGCIQRRNDSLVSQGKGDQHCSDFGKWILCDRWNPALTAFLFRLEDQFSCRPILDCRQQQRTETTWDLAGKQVVARFCQALKRQLESKRAHA